MRKILLSSLAIAIPVMAFAVSPEQTVEARRGYFALVGTEFGPLVAMAKGEMPYDVAAAKAHAADLVALATYTQDDLLASGPSMAELPGKTRAKATIYTDLPGYQAAGQAFYDAVIALDAVAGNGPEALAPAVGKLGGTCKGCHDDFRAKDF